MIPRWGLLAGLIAALLVIATGAYVSYCFMWK